MALIPFVAPEGLVGLAPAVLRAHLLKAMRFDGQWVRALHHVHEKDPLCYVDGIQLAREVLALSPEWVSALMAYARCSAGGGERLQRHDLLHSVCTTNWSLALSLYSGTKGPESSTYTDRAALKSVLRTGKWFVGFRVLGDPGAYIANEDLARHLVECCGRDRVPALVTWATKKSKFFQPLLCTALGKALIEHPTPARCAIVTDELIPYLRGRNLSRENEAAVAELEELLIARAQGPVAPMPLKAQLTAELFMWRDVGVACLWRPTHSTYSTLRTLARALSASSASDGWVPYAPGGETEISSCTGPVLFTRGDVPAPDIVSTRYIVICDVPENLWDHHIIDPDVVLLAVQRTRTRSEKAIGVLQVTLKGSSGLRDEEAFAKRLRQRHGIDLHAREDVPHILLVEIRAKEFVIEVTLLREVREFVQALLE